MKKPAEMAGPLWVPERQTIIWIDGYPQSGREMRNVHPFLVLSPRIFNERTSLVIGLPMTTAEYNADNPFAIPVGTAKNRNAGKQVTCCAISPNRLTGVFVRPDPTRWADCRIPSLRQSATV
nr:type II toxin-antitoxin system PemK/MazF family toxin [Leptospirillum ferrooxidans]